MPLKESVTKDPFLKNISKLSQTTAFVKFSKNEFIEK